MPRDEVEIKRKANATKVRKSLAAHMMRDRCVVTFPRHYKPLTDLQTAEESIKAMMRKALSAPREHCAITWCDPNHYRPLTYWQAVEESAKAMAMMYRVLERRAA